MSEVRTAAQARQELGVPVGSGATNGQFYQEFRTRRKFAEPDKGIYLVMGDVVTLGLAEAVFFPRELFVAVRRSVLGQTIRFTYDGDGNVIAILRDGKPDLLGPRVSAPVSPAPAPPSDTDPEKAPAAP